MLVWIIAVNKISHFSELYICEHAYILSYKLKEIFVKTPLPKYILQLTHLPKAAIFAQDNFKCILLNKNDKMLIRISLKFVPRGPIYNNPALVKVIAWRRTGAKPLPEVMLTQFIDAYMRH